MKQLKKILSPPVFEDEIKTQQAYLLNIIIWVLVCIPILYVIYTAAFAADNLNRAAIQTAFGETVNIVLLWMLHRGYIKAASVFQVAAFWFFFTVTAVTGPGIQGEAYLLGYGLVIAIAGLLLGGWGALVVTTISILSGGAMIYAQAQGMFGSGFVSSPLTTWVVSLLLFPVGATLQYLGTRVTRQALARARASEERYRLISRVSSDYTFSTAMNAEGKMYLNWVTGALERMTGYTFEEYVATGGWQGHLHPEDVEIDERAFEQLSRNQSAISEVRTFQKNGEIVWVRVYAHPVWDERRNKLAGIVGAVQNIDEQKRSEQALKYERDLLQIFLDNIPDTVYFKDRESRFVRINSAQARMLGVDSPQDALGKTDLDFMPAELAKAFLEEERRIVKTGEPVVNRIEFNPTRDGQLRWLSATKVPVKDMAGNISGMIGISRDVTEQKLAQEYEQNRRAILEKVLRLGQEVTQVQNFITTLQKIWHGVRNELDFDRIGIYIYNPDTNNMDGTFGTNNHGEMVDEWDIHIRLDENNPEVGAFNGVLRETDGLYFTPNYEVDHDVQNIPIMQGVRDFAAVAARVGDKPVAVICVDQVISGRSITSEQLEALRLFAGYAGLAIENSRLNEVLQTELQQQRQAEEQEARRRSMLEKVLELGKRVTETTDLNTTLQRIWHGVHDDLGFDRLAVFLYNEKRYSMDSMIGTSIHGSMEDTTGHWYPISDWSTFKVVLEKPDGLFLTHNYDVENNIPEGHEMFGVKDYAAVAAWAGNKPVAVICVDHMVTKQRIAPEQLEALRLFAGYAGLALENAKLYAALQDELVQQKQAEERETRRRFMLEKVVELGKQVTETTDFITTIKRIWHSIHNDLSFDRVGIFLYTPEQNAVKGTYGTNRQGEMIEEWDLRIPLDGDVSETLSFISVINEEDGIYVTHDYSVERNIPSGHIMDGVKEYAAVAAWAGDKPIGILCVDNFISGRTITEEQLEALRLFAGYAGLAIQNSQLNATLEEDLAHRQNLIEQLETKNAELERFTYTVSHDLKSPLVTITGFLGYVEKDALAGDTARLKSSIDRIYKAAQKMQRLLNDLLELSRIGRLMNEPENIPFSAIVREALEHVRGRLETNQVKVEVQDSLPIVRGDKIRLVEVVQNLVDNAAKFTKDRPDPLIKIGTDDSRPSGSPIFFVSDNGIGIASQYHEKIFGLFDKLDPTVEGTGVGLTLVKRIIEVHGGTIWLESQPGNGTTFYFTLPSISFEE